MDKPPRYVFVIETDDNGVEAVFAHPGRAIRYARQHFELRFPRGSVTALLTGKTIIARPAWDDAGDASVTLTRRLVQ